jgi:hypothetical protein
VVVARGGVLRGATGWRRDLEATDVSEVWGHGGLGGWIGGGVHGSDQSQGLRDEAAQSDGLCVTSIVTQYMLRINSSCVYIYICLDQSSC